MTDALCSVVSLRPHAAISEDDAAIHGSHLLGHEGEPAETISIAVRQ